MAGEGDGNDFRYSQDQSAALASIQRFPTTNEDIVQRFHVSLQQLISDAARQGIDLSTREGLMSPHDLSALNQQATRLRSTVVIPTLDAPLKTRRDPTDRPEIVPERLARGSREHREENDSNRGYDQDRMARGRDRPMRRTHRRDRSSSLEESDQNHHRKRQRGTVRLHGLNREHEEVNSEERGQKLTIS
ncbi:hypothetical protein LWI29_036817 [Acer saccharum]|uniref:Uncharacterized protein n=1 Tax=Acer saccharum TaxID=4024 RepID=A0AA39TUF2_ACESA|nr:hypothetical protein LWI29_036817 [Acer saccharum]